jgi:hypothetical protein
LFVTFYAAMAVAALVIELIFQALGLIPTTRSAQVAPTTITFNYTTILNILFLIVAGFFILRFLRTGGPSMLRMMNADPKTHEGHEHAAHPHASNVIK